MLGGNFTHARSTGFSYGVDTNYDNRRFSPFAGVTYDLNRALSVYASYTTIFNPQDAIGEDGRILAPVSGKNIEAGIKGDWFGGRLNASAAIFRVHQDNTAEHRLRQRPLRLARGECQVGGIELEVGGRLAEGCRSPAAIR